MLRIEVSDNGVGFEPDEVRAGRIGLSSMAERAAVIGADLTVTSAPGKGTRVVMTLPHKPRIPAEGEPDERQP
ncbi:hypothetical protein GXW82_15010 [Streptacidiphilus sp. 4-A2]|nr:hypothetical protein [Streptacidiphilus sp. 4-A2]